ncbi:hypothetical protein F5Y16DRAFT_402116 [Xylariaceae sp. FL0255]|nr:hypothetical protein F5Y16DRAFT_402116 [Xylariaceae sp. FL0255]
MQTQFAFLSLLSTVFAAPQAVPASSSGPQGFDVINFKAQCYPRTTCEYEFDIFFNGSYVAYCSAIEQPYAVGDLPEVDQRACDNNANWIWSVSLLPGGGIALTIQDYFNSTTNLGNYQNIPADEFEIVPDGATEYQVYIGPANFTFPAVYSSA